MVKPAPSGGGESRDIFGAQGSGLPGHHRVAQPPGGFCHELFGSRYSGLPSHHRIAQPPGGHCNELFEPEYSGPASSHRQRVLKPPGGGSSDIFGADGAAQQPARRNNRNQSQLQSSMFTDMMETKSKSDGNPVTGEGYAIANGVKEIAASNGVAKPTPASDTASNAPKTNGVAKSAPPSRPGRVPPGGFSSGLW